ncbi:hypothetical protein [Streptomyces sp. NPDC051211]|uniref:hypothetical protein n=1 Tax=Streptomyces sp. NPDC051211 TaxID=3154643 RepID=UPI00344B1D56
MKPPLPFIASTLLSSAVIGASVLLPVSAAVAAPPAATCTVTPMFDANSSVIHFDGAAFPANSEVRLSPDSGAGSGVVVKTDAAGAFRHTSPGEPNDAATVKVTATGTNVQVPCRLVGAPPEKDPKQEQEEARTQYRQGFQDGRNDARDDCRKTPPKPGLTGLDPNYEKGYLAGQDFGFERFCQTGTDRQN